MLYSFYSFTFFDGFFWRLGVKIHSSKTSQGLSCCDHSYLIQFETSFAPLILDGCFSHFGVSRGCLTFWDDIFYTLITSLNNTSNRSMTNVCFVCVNTLSNVVKNESECDKTDHSDFICCSQCMIFSLILNIGQNFFFFFFLFQ